MMNNVMEIERNSLDLRFQPYRIKNSKSEDKLLQSIIKNGIRDPLRGVDVKEAKVLLDGFKRFRCAQKLSIHMVPYVSIGEDEAMGIIELLRDSFSKKLNIVEEAKMINELQDVYGLSVTEIATQLEKSKAWVSLRAGMLGDMSPLVADKILTGKLSARSYIYSIAPFTRVNGTDRNETDAFVKAVAGQSLSTRDVDILAQGYFKGPEEVREQIRKGKLEWSVEQLKKQQNHYPNGCTKLERKVIRRLELVRNNMQKLTVEINDNRLKSSDFIAQAHVITEGILDHNEAFNTAIKRFYDQSR